MTLLPGLHDAPALTVFRQCGSSPKGLTEAEAAERLARHGENRIDAGAGPRRLRDAARSPFVALLTGLALVFAALADLRGSVTVTVMVVLSVLLRYWQQARSDNAVAALRNQVTMTATVRRRAGEGHPAREREVPAADLVPGDVVLLGPGDVVSADVRVLTAAGLLVDQSTLTGEALPVAKTPPRRGPATDLLEAPALVFAGTSVIGGTATAVVLATGASTRFGSLATAAGERRAESSFEAGVRRVGWTLIRFMLVMVPIVLVVNGTVTGSWEQAAMFAVAVAVGLTPEMLPVVVTTNLARGATVLSRQRVIVKRLDAIQDLAAMDVLCVDKTGTLTEDRAAFAHGIDLDGRPDGEPGAYAHLAARLQSGPPDRLDEAILDQLAGADEVPGGALVDEFGFDPRRRRTSVVVRRAGADLFVTKGDPAEVIPRCTHARRAGEVVALTPGLRDAAADLVRAHAGHGLRLLAVAAREAPPKPRRYTEHDETDLVLVGFAVFTDPVRDGAAETVASLAARGVAIKLLTGDNQHVAARVAAEAGIAVGEVVLGSDVDSTGDATLRVLAGRATVFARLTPAHKARVVRALREGGHAVGFLGDGVNDVAALRAADVGIAPDTATDAAKDAADLVLLDRDLSVLANGVVEGRRTLANTLKYVTTTAASNFGNVLTVLAASAFLPFLPILPIQLVASNLLYDLAQLALAWDRVDEAYLARPRRWDARGLATSMLVFGPLSSVFDLTTFAVLGRVFDAGPALFRTGWFVEGLLSQVLVVLVLRGRAVFAPARAVIAAAAAATLAGVLLPVSPLAGALRLQSLPVAYLPWLLVVLAAYALAARAVARRFARPAWW
ncbi:magnesium-translocating P-type ATPase [Amycolatopsis mongoliensis]|uniref:Magnesium-transporting ATPase, P-type 1 n=1 Tax=Amycolatopsis mongoliensis TaxID=715475 RepID=A0A9Y2JJC4_9PSEU|nr:magnesium-translocating P-type ATPase [Amycolatopsis sp. 4-36]WIX98794.1 magnesium-translocating P-type ATPase [Amycolatopsis sp. 4-36]